MLICFSKKNQAKFFNFISEVMGIDGRLLSVVLTITVSKFISFGIFWSKLEMKVHMSLFDS